MTDPKTEADILEGYRQAEDLKKADFARELKISRQRLNNYLQGISRPDSSIVLDWLRNGYADFVHEMALEIFVRRPELERPCICLERIGDNGPCPRHSEVLVEEAE